MRSQRAIRAEANRCHKILKKANEDARKPNLDRAATRRADEARAALQALYWALKDNAQQPSKCI